MVRWYDLKLFEGSFSGGDLKIDLDNQRRCFEIDRKVVVRQLKALQLAITDGATEMEMVAAENVFDTRLSTLLKRRARSLYQTAQSLNVLRLAVARARFPRLRKTATRDSRKR